MRMEKMDIPFQISGEGLTRILRQLIGEKEVRQAMQILDCFPALTVAEKENVLTGTAVLKGVGNTLHYEETVAAPDPIADRFGNFDSAWISPDGTFYGCRHYGHIEKAAEIVQTIGIGSTYCDEMALTKRGWIKLSDCELYCGPAKITQSQADTLFDFARMTDKMITHLGVPYTVKNVAHLLKKVAE
jgi:hypothetical protein